MAAGDVRVTGDLVVEGHVSASTMTVPSNAVRNVSVAADAAIARSKLAATASDNAVVYSIPLNIMTVWDSGQPLPAAAANDDLGFVNGTFGTDVPTLQAGDIGGATSTRYCRFQWALPAEYVDADDVKIRISAACLTTLCDTSCTVDVECYESDRDGSSTGDICATAAQSINALTHADKDFTITATNLVVGDLLDFRLAIAYADAGDLGAMIPEIAQVEMLLDIII